MKALGSAFHPDCLRCVSCASAFGPGARMFASTVPGEEARPICEGCHEKSLGVCATCGEGLHAGKYASVLGRRYHTAGACISCIACRKPFAKGDPMFQRDGFPVCREHARGPLPLGAEENMRKAGPAEPAATKAAVPPSTGS